MRGARAVAAVRVAEVPRVGERVTVRVGPDRGVLEAVVTLPSPAGVREAVTVGAWLAAVTVTLSVVSPVPPLPSETVTLAVNVPAVA